MNLLDALKKIRDEGPKRPSDGICYNVECLAGVEAGRISQMAAKWPEFSGLPAYPVPHSTLNPMVAFDQSSGVEMWDEGEYAAARRRLLDFLIAELEAEES